jgi:hypothetical protein
MSFRLGVPTGRGVYNFRPPRAAISNRLDDAMIPEPVAVEDHLRDLLLKRFAGRELPTSFPQPP